MKRQYTITIALLAAAFTLGSCVKDELHNTAHPDEGTVVVKPTWTPDPSNPDAPQPDPAVVTITVVDANGNTVDLNKNPDYPFTPGEYTIITTNDPEGVTVDGTTAIVDPADPTTIPEEWSDLGPFIDGDPDWLFTGVDDIHIGEDTETSLQPKLEQQMRELTIILTPTGDAADRITAVDACLTGVAGSIDFAKGTYDNPSNVMLPFSLNEDGTWTATVCLLGVAGTAQHLKGSIRFADDNPNKMGIGSDLTEALADFSADKRSPFIIDGTLVETPTEAGFTADIIGWQQTDGGNVDVH